MRAEECDSTEQLLKFAGVLLWLLSGCVNDVTDRCAGHWSRNISPLVYLVMGSQSSHPGKDNFATVDRIVEVT